jgi:tripeptide aminopeptidase
MVTSLVERVLDLAITIQQIPAPTFAEQPRANFLQEVFTAEGLSDVECDAAGNVLGRLPGKIAGRPLLVTAHLDTVFPAGTDLSFHFENDQIYGPGIGDNSLGLAGLLGLLWLLRSRGHTLPGDIWFAANVGEEGLGNLSGMRAIVDRFGRSPRAYLVVEGMAQGQIYHRALGVQRYRIAAHTAGGHSWVDYGRRSAIHELASLITWLTSISLPADPRTSLNVGVIGGGTSINTIAADAWLELDLRSEGERTLKNLARNVQELVKSANQPGVSFTAELIGNRPAGAIPADHPLVLLTRRVLNELGIEPKLNIGSTDANVPLSRGLPAVCIGLTTGGGAHTVGEFIHTKPLEPGLRQLATVVETIFDLI